MAAECGGVVAVPNRAALEGPVR
ncbi:MAG: hypothetical protein JWR41_2116, partial [Modestobacter sp.]|nr:hypothetical protein [Modestobacter sp.]